MNISKRRTIVSCSKRSSQSYALPFLVLVVTFAFAIFNDANGISREVHFYASGLCTKPTTPHQSSSSSMPLSNSSPSIDRRTSLLEMIQRVALTTTTTAVSSTILASPAAATATTTPTTATMPTMPQVDITHKVFMDVRVARTDGSTYVRDDLPDTFDNRVLFQRLTFGLYGRTAPNCVNQFLSYIGGTGSGVGAVTKQQRQQEQQEYDIDNPYPSYSRSTFPSLDQETGLLMGGNIASLKLKNIGTGGSGGSPALVYGSRVLPATLWIDSISQKLSHNTKGLLTHKDLDVLPNFGITTRSQQSLDSTHTVFGCVLWDDETLQFFRQLEDLPTYSVDRPSGLDEFGTAGVATNVFNAQREFFRGAAQTFGDDRVSKLYNGKLMRRMEVLQVGML